MASPWLLLVVLLASKASLVALEYPAPKSSMTTASSIRELEQSVETSKNARHPRRTRTFNQLPEFSGSIGNVTAVLGRDVRLVCTVENLGSYQVAWLKEESKTILSIDTNIIITNYRIFLIPDEEERKWVLHIKDVQESDRTLVPTVSDAANTDDSLTFEPNSQGYYQCQVNTSPMRSTSGHLEVVVPPAIIESQTSQIGEVMERSNVSLQCRANGHPKPNVFWRRDDGHPIRLSGKFNGTGIIQATSQPSTQSKESQDSQTIVSQLTDVKSDKLSLNFVDRSMAGIYVCSASNGIPSHAIKKIPLYVKFAPQTSVQHKYISVSLGDQLEVDCQIEAFPKPNSYWSKKSSTQSAKTDQSNRWPQTLSSFGNSYATSYRPKQLLLQSDSGLDLSPLSNHTGSLMESERITAHRYRDGEQNQTEPQAYGMQFNNHPHNRIQFRQVDHHLANQRPLSEIPNSGESKAYVTVKQTAINSYTYKLKLTIAKVQHDDYGEYSCISSNAIGTSESHIIVTAADKPTNGAGGSQMSPDYRSVEESDYQRDQLESTKPRVQSEVRRSSSGNRVVYDENYLQAIKTRQNNFVGSSRLQQKLKSKSRNSTVKVNRPSGFLFHIVIFTSQFVAIYLCKMTFVAAHR